MAKYYFFITFLALSCSTPEKQLYGAADPGKISSIMRSHDVEMKSCFVKNLKGSTQNCLFNPVATFTIDPEGKVKGFSLLLEDRSLTDVERKVESCLRDVFSKFTFPAPIGGVNISIAQSLRYGVTPN